MSWVVQAEYSTKEVVGFFSFVCFLLVKCKESWFAWPKQEAFWYVRVAQTLLLISVLPENLLEG